jgi:hypothetical protein
MGLDMYLDRALRINGITAQGISALNGYFSWEEYKSKGDKYADCTLEQWCGVNEKDVPKWAIDAYRSHYITHYSTWDTEHKYGRSSLWEEVGYWRKANAIHKWFVNNVQGYVDDCGYYEVSREQLEDLLDTCIQVRDASMMKHGWVNNGQRFENGMWCPIFEEGEVIVDTTVAEALLPTQSGFFFGGTDYDQWYMEDIMDTIEIITKVLETTDFDL